MPHKQQSIVLMRARDKKRLSRQREEEIEREIEREYSEGIRGYPWEPRGRTTKEIDE